MNGADPETLAHWIAQRARTVAAPVIGINGSQASGKSTLARRLCEILAQRHRLRVVVLSLDDLYLPRVQRERLAAEVHPLLRTRGVPGTHDVALGLALLAQLRRGGGTVHMPKFHKVLDDRAPEDAWTTVEAPVDAVLFEGWCVGTPPQADAALATPVNALEADEDPDGRWRRYVNHLLANDYARLFEVLDRLLFLRTPDFGCILRWRLQQEQENAAEARRLGHEAPAMNAGRLERFIQHYERLTRHALAVLPARADATVELGPEHEWRSLHFRSG